MVLLHQRLPDSTNNQKAVLYCFYFYLNTLPHQLVFFETAYLRLGPGE